MAYIPVYQSLLGHKFMIRLQIATGQPVAHLTGHLVCLWLWSIDNARDGVLPGEAAIIAHAAQWAGDADAWLAALLNSGFVAMEADGRLVIHDWDDYIGNYFDSLERHRRGNRDRQARYRENHRPPPRNVTDNVSGNVTVTPVTLRNDINLTKINGDQINEGTMGDEPVALRADPPTDPSLPRAAPKPTTLNRQQLARFDRWYALYPNKQRRPEAERAFRKLDPDDALTDRMIADVDRRKAGRKWAKGFIDYPATYLNNRVWEDDIEPMESPGYAPARPTSRDGKLPGHEAAEAARRILNNSPPAESPPAIEAAFTYTRRGPR